MYTKSSTEFPVSRGSTGTTLPHDDAVYRCDCNGEPSAKLPDSDPMKTALKGIMAEIGL